MTWDGEGIDPWLPHRLDARLGAAEMEREIRAAVWSELSSWLVALERRMIRDGARPDGHAVYALEPRWRDAVKALVTGKILKAIGLAFKKAFGKRADRIGWQDRPAVTRYLTEVTNRLVRVPDEVYDLVASELAAGANLGEGVPQLSKRVDTLLSRTGTERWANRATAIARTEVIGALNFGRWESFKAIIEDDPEETWEVLWLAADDRRTRPTHDLADGQRVPAGDPFRVGGFELRFPGDPLGPPQEVLQCRCTLLLVDGDEEVNLDNRQMRRTP